MMLSWEILLVSEVLITLLTAIAATIPIIIRTVIISTRVNPR
jgi:hypothetical protein